MMLTCTLEQQLSKMLWVDFPDTGPALCCNGKRYFVVVEPLVTKKPQTRLTMNVVATVTSTKNDFAMGVAYPCSCYTILSMLYPCCARARGNNMIALPLLRTRAG